MKTLFLSLSSICLVFATGCGLDGPIPQGRQHGATATSTTAGDQSVGDVKTSETTADKSADAGNAAPEKKRRGRRLDTPPEKTSEAAPGTVREKAAVGMGEKGRGYGGGIITESVHQMFTAREKIVLDQMRHAQDLYKAEHNGQHPKTHEEFMEKIIKANDLRLPILPQGERYVYDPDKDDLMVERPSNQ